MLASLGALVLGVLCINYGFFWHDNAVLVVGARALALGEGYVDASHPACPPMVKEPPGFAVLLCPLVWLFGARYKWYRLLGIVAHACAAGVVYTVSRRRLGISGALLVALLYISHQTVIWDVYVLYPTAIYTLIFLWIVQLVEREDRPRAALIASLLAAGYYLWYGACVVIGATVAFLAAKRQWRDACVIAAITAVAIGPWLWWSFRLSGHLIHPEHEAELARLLNKESPDASLPIAFAVHFAREAEMLPAVIGHELVPLRGARSFDALVHTFHAEVLMTPCEITVGLLTLYGLAITGLRRRDFRDVYTIGFLLIQCVWQVLFEYMIPALPFLYEYLYRGTLEVWTLIVRAGRAEAPGSTTLRNRSPGPHLPRRLAPAIGAILLCITVARDKFYWSAAAFPVIDGGFARWRWIADRTEPSAIIATSGIPFPQVQYLYTGRRFLDAGDPANGVWTSRATYLLRPSALARGARETPVTPSPPPLARALLLGEDQVTGLALYRLQPTPLRRPPRAAGPSRASTGRPPHRLP